MASYYVATSGGVNSPAPTYGTTPQTPWATIAYAVTQVTAGDTIYLMPGTYTENNIKPTVSGTSSAQITITSYNLNNRAHIRSTSGDSTFQFVHVSYWVVRGLVFGGTSNTDRSGVGAIKIGDYQTNTAHTDYIVFEDNEIKWIHTKHAVLMVSNSATYAVRYPTIRNNYIHNTSGTAANYNYNETLTQAGNVIYALVEDNRLVSVAFIGIDLIGQDGTGRYPASAQPRYCVIRNNTVINVASPAPGSPGVGIKIDGAGPYLLIENNLTQYCAGMVVGAEPWYDLGLTNQYGIIIRNNVFDASSGTPDDYAIQWGVGSGGMSIATYATFTGEIFDSVAVHNMCIGTGHAIWLHRAYNTALKNNVVWNRGTLSLYGSENLTRDETLTTSGNVINGNVYYADDLGQDFVWYGGTAYGSFAAWKSGTSQDANSVYGKPTLVDRAANNYALVSGSIGSGAAVALTTTTNTGSSSTTLTVANADYFCNGHGRIGGDQIRIGASTFTVQSVNYSTNTITLAAAGSWSSGANVHYVYAGSAPSIGLTSTVGTGDPIIPDDDDDDDGNSTIRYSVQIAAGTDNCYYRAEPENLDTTDLLFVGDYNGEAYDYAVGVRFELPASIAPGGATSAQLQMIADFALGTCAMRIYGEKSATPAAFSTAANFAGRTRTTTYVDWSLAAVSGNQYTSPDISDILNELATAYGGLDAGDYVVLFVESQGAGFLQQNMIGWRGYATSPAGSPTLQYNTYNAAAGGTLDLSVESNSDDASASTVNFYLNDTTNYIGHNTVSDYNYQLALRFVLPSSIPAGATVTSAYITIKAGGTVGGIEPLRIRAQASANANTFSTAADLQNRLWTTAYADWTPGAWVDTTAYDSVDISEVIQALIDSYNGLADGAGIGIVVMPQTSTWTGSQKLMYVKALESGAGNAPALHIEWEAASVNSRGYATGTGIGLRIGA